MIFCASRRRSSRTYSITEVSCVAAHEVEDLGRGAHAAQRRLLHAVAAGSSLVSTSFSSRSAAGWMPSSVAMRSTTSLRRRSVKLRPAPRRPGRARGGPGSVAMICGCSLRISSATDARVHPLQALDAARRRRSARMRSSSDGRLVVAERLGQHGADVVVGVARRARSAPRPRRGSARARRRCGRAVTRLQRAMASPSFCTSFGAEVLEDLGGFFLAERHQQDRAVGDAGVTHRVLTHALTTLATIFGSSRAILRASCSGSRAPRLDHRRAGRAADSLQLGRITARAARRIPGRSTPKNGVTQQGDQEQVLAGFLGDARWCRAPSTGDFGERSHAPVR